ncbi:MAG: hypothetical protein HRT35_20770 [Algicola sp.]|nr:hypothetical protein [Algicola sp.]
MKSTKPEAKRKIDNPLAKQFVVQWKILLSFMVIVVLIAISLSATARAGRNGVPAAINGEAISKCSLPDRTNRGKTQPCQNNPITHLYPDKKGICQ